jgi:hypothetical protein
MLGALVTNAIYWMILVPSLIRVIRSCDLNMNSQLHLFSINGNIAIYY